MSGGIKTIILSYHIGTCRCGKDNAQLLSNTIYCTDCVEDNLKTFDCINCETPMGYCLDDFEDPRGVICAECIERFRADKAEEEEEEASTKKKSKKRTKK
jgi:hypothetical protein